MGADGQGQLARVLAKYEAEILDGWVKEQSGVRGLRAGPIREAELREQCAEFLHLLREALERSGDTDTNGRDWESLREMLAGVSRSRGAQGFSPSEIATFVYSFKRPLFECLRREFSQDGDLFAGEAWSSSALLDRLGLWTVETYQKAREEVIARQHQELLELSTPVVKLWEGVLALPMIGTLDSERTQIVMESMLQRIVETGSEVAIIDITGVPTVDTLVAQHLLKTVTAARLMGADCIISGIRPQIAQTIVQLGVDLGGVTTKATLADAFALALRRNGMAIVKAPASA